LNSHSRFLLGIDVGLAQWYNAFNVVKYARSARKAARKTARYRVENDMSWGMGNNAMVTTIPRPVVSNMKTPLP
jgi:hypothetical protein